MRRPRRNIADGLQACPPQPARDRIIGAERKHRQRRDGARLLAVRHDASPRGPRHGARANRRTRNRRVDDKTLPVERGTERAQHRGLTAEQMCATADIEQQSIKPIERHQRRETVAPVGDSFQQVPVRRLVGVEHLHVGTDRARIRQRQANLQADIRGSVVQRRDLQRVVQLRDNDTRTRIIRRGVLPRKLALQSVGRQARQPKAEDTPPVHGRGPHHISTP